MFLLEAYLVPLACFATLVLLISSVRILREYERTVVFTLGRFQHVRGPGLVLLIPFIQEMVRVDLRIQVIEIPSQDVISRDNVSRKVDAALYFNIVNSERPIIKVQNFMRRPTCLRKPRFARYSDSRISTRCSPSARSSAPTSRSFSIPLRRPRRRFPLSGSRSR